MGKVWTRTDWNDIIQRVNDLAENPPAGCEPIDTLPEVDPNHIWTKEDITDIQDKLIEICENNTFDEELRLWKQAIIDEIEATITAGWCGCDECSNAYGLVVQYCGSFEATECRNCGECDSDICPSDECSIAKRQAVQSAGTEASIKTEQWADAWGEYCILQDEVDTLQAELDALKIQLTALKEARDYACAHGTPEECDAAQAAVDAKQKEVDEKQAKLDQKIAERDAKLAEANGYELEAEEAAWESIALADAVGTETGAPTYSSFITEDGSWTNTDCNQLGSSDDPRHCRVSWSVARRATSHFVGGGSYIGNWNGALSGGFTRKGTPYVTYIPGCGVVPRYACSSCCMPPCPIPPCSTPCSTTYTYEIRLTMIYPNPTGE